MIKLDKCIHCGGHLDYAQDSLSAWCPFCKSLFVDPSVNDMYPISDYPLDEFDYDHDAVIGRASSLIPWD